ncbi:MAG: Ger(x)C family spore germination protein [Clostridiaceae bacterium]|nr:Ger(x)C family spore germination protein [Clostridiaceae bacterium]
MIEKLSMKITAAVLLLPTLIILLTGCWDSHELDALFIVTGVAFDEAKDPEKMDITLQIGKAKSNVATGGKSSSQDNSMIFLKATYDTLLEGLIELDQESSRRLYLPHCQVLVLGEDIAKQGIQNRIDMILRDQKIRLELPVLVAEGRAEKVLTAKLDQEVNTGLYLASVMQELYNMSPYYRVRMLDFVSRMQDGTSSTVAPIATLHKEGTKQEIIIRDLAVFKKDKLAGRLDFDKTMGYLWALGKVRRCNITAKNDSGQAVFTIFELDTTRNVEMKPDGGIRVKLSVNTKLGIGELRGFDSISTEDMMPYLVELAQNQIRAQITDTFETVKVLNTDIYGFGVSVHRAYPKEWKEMKGQWDELFPEIELDVQVKAHLHTIGQIVKSLEMEVDNFED